MFQYSGNFVHIFEEYENTPILEFAVKKKDQSWSDGIKCHIIQLQQIIKSNNELAE